MKAYTYIEEGKFALTEKPIPSLIDGGDAIVKIVCASICASDVHIKNGAVPRAKKGITVGHEAVGVVEKIGERVKKIKVGDRVTINVETFCGECYFCKNGYVNNCKSEQGGWALGCRIDGMLAEYVRVPLADTGLNVIPTGVSFEQALFVGDVLATGFWAVKIADVKKDDTALVIGAGPTGLCLLECLNLKNPKAIIICESNLNRAKNAKKLYPNAMVCTPRELSEILKENCSRGGADVVFEVAGGEDTFRMAYESARPNATVVVVALYEKPQILPLPDMYGKNLTFKTGGVDGCDCDEILSLIANGKINTLPFITHEFPLSQVEEAFELFSNGRDEVIKVVVKP